MRNGTPPRQARSAFADAVERVADVVTLAQTSASMTGAELGAGHIAKAYDTAYAGSAWFKELTARAASTALLADASGSSATAASSVVGALLVDAFTTDIQAACALIGFLAERVARDEGSTAADVLREIVEAGQKGSAS